MSTPTVIDPSDKNQRMLALLNYKGHLISFDYGSAKMHISRDGQTLYTSAVKFKRKITDGHTKTHDWNSNRNVQLEGDMLYFIDTSSNIVIFDLKKLLDMPLECRNSYEPLKGPTGQFEDFCVDKGQISTLTMAGEIASGGKQANLKEKGLGTQFSTIETLAGYFVVASYDTAKKCKVFAVLNSDLVALATLTVAGEYMVQNMLLFVKDSTLHILSARNRHRVDHLLFNGDAIHLLNTFETNSSYTMGVVWLTDGEQAIVCGDTNTLKTIKL